MKRIDGDEQTLAIGFCVLPSISCAGIQFIEIDGYNSLLLITHQPAQCDLLQPHATLVCTCCT